MIDTSSIEQFVLPFLRICEVPNEDDHKDVVTIEQGRIKFTIVGQKGRFGIIVPKGKGVMKVRTGKKGGLLIITPPPRKKKPQPKPSLNGRAKRKKPKRK